MQFPDETIEELFADRIRILQAKSGYRYSVDPFLLVDFARVRADERIVDLGSGSGVIPLLLADRSEAREIVGLERQETLVERSRRSVALNDLDEKIRIVHGDVRVFSETLDAESFEVVLTNPPYRPADMGRISTGDERSQARHELAGGLVDFLRAASLLLKSGGRFYIVHMAERLAELMSEMRCFRLEPKRVRLVHSREGDEAQLVLVEGRKDGNPGLKVESPLVIYQGEGRDYSDEVRAMYGMER